MVRCVPGSLELHPQSIDKLLDILGAKYVMVMYSISRIHCLNVDEHVSTAESVG